MDVLGNGLERGEVAGVNLDGHGWQLSSLARAPLTALSLACAWRRNSPHQLLRKVWLQTFVATTYGRRYSSARAVTQRRSQVAPRLASLVFDSFHRLARGEGRDGSCCRAAQACSHPRPVWGPPLRVLG